MRFSVLFSIKFLKLFENYHESLMNLSRDRYRMQMKKTIFLILFFFLFNQSFILA